MVLYCCPSTSCTFTTKLKPNFTSHLRVPHPADTAAEAAMHLWFVLPLLNTVFFQGVPATTAGVSLLRAAAEHLRLAAENWPVIAVAAQSAPRRPRDDDAAPVGVAAAPASVAKRVRRPPAPAAHGSAPADDADRAVVSAAIAAVAIAEDAAAVAVAAAARLRSAAERLIFG